MSSYSIESLYGTISRQSERLLAAEARIAALERCVAVADKIRESVGPSSGPPTGKLRAAYDAARAGVK